MCGRFTNNAKPEQIEKEFKIEAKNTNLFQQTIISERMHCL
jgi:putative SOS response-associated peptidase YedK